MLHVVGLGNVTAPEYFPISEMVVIEGDPVIDEGNEDHDQLFSNKIQLLSVVFIFEVCVTAMLERELHENAHGFEFVEHSNVDFFWLLGG